MAAGNPVGGADYLSGRPEAVKERAGGHENARFRPDLRVNDRN
jgi:hypothetical protein